jgi:hypothetical protein
LGRRGLWGGARAAGGGQGTGARWRRARMVRAVGFAFEKVANRASSRSLRAAGIRACRIARAQGRGASASTSAAAWFGIAANYDGCNTGGQGKKRTVG